MWNWSGELCNVGGAREDRATTAVDRILAEMVQNLLASQGTLASVNVFSHWQSLPILNDEGAY